MLFDVEVVESQNVFDINFVLDVRVNASANGTAVTLPRRVTGNRLAGANARVQAHQQTDLSTSSSESISAEARLPITRDLAIVLVGFPVTPFPRMEFATC